MHCDSAVSWLHKPMAVRFSPRQAQIVGLIASGYSDKQVAAALKVSQRTVRTQLERLYAANGMHCRAQAVSALLSPGA